MSSAASGTYSLIVFCSPVIRTWPLGRMRNAHCHVCPGGLVGWVVGVVRVLVSGLTSQMLTGPEKNWPPASTGPEVSST